MTVTDWVNGAAASATLVVAIGLGAIQSQAPVAEGASASPVAAKLVDADGQTVVVQPFHRIASNDPLIDYLLLELSEPDRIVALSGYGATHSPVRYRYVGYQRMERAQDTEAVLSLKPDLFIFNDFGAPKHREALRSHGVALFNLGQMRGVTTLQANARAVATLLGHPERGERFIADFTRRFDRVANDVPANGRKRGLFLNIYGSQIFGGAAGTSYDDVLTHAGLIDAAAPRYSNWPQYSPEEVLAMDPDVVVTRKGMKALLCGSALLQHLRACATGQVIEIEGDLIDDPGALMLDAAEEIRARVYGEHNEH